MIDRATKTWWDAQPESDLRELLTVGINGPDDQTRGWIAERVGEDSVLDVGCGTGELAARLLPPERKTLRYIGADLSLSMIDICRDRFPSWASHFVQADVEHLPWPDLAFDWVVCRHVIDHLEDYRTACAELRRVARRVIVVLFNPIDSAYSEWMGSPSVVTKSHDQGIFAALGSTPDKAVYKGSQIIIAG